MRNDSLRPLIAVCALGLLVRLGLLLLTGRLELQSDEANYVYLALSWDLFGFYSDSYRYLWPPGYPFVLELFLSWLEMGALFAVKLVQVLASASIGMSIMLLTRRLFDGRTALVAGLIWCAYLPLASFTHFLWAETLFFACLAPALYLVYSVLDRGAAQEPVSLRLIAAGLLMAAALYFKEVPLYLAPVLALLVGLACLLRPAADVPAPGAVEGLRRAALFGLSMAVLIVPWTFRNYNVYGRVVPLGKSLGENAYIGLNEEYKNFDLTPFSRHRQDVEAPIGESRVGLIQAPLGSGWRRAEEIRNTPDRLDENVSRGLAYAREHPAWLLRSRIKKLADLVVPLSFFLRHQGLEHYTESALGHGLLRRFSVIWAVACPVLLLLLALPGFAALRSTRARLYLTVVVGYFLATSLLVAMSRFRLPLVLLLIPLAAGALCQARDVRWRTPRVALPVLLGWALLGVLWWIDWPETAAVVRLAWGTT